MEKINLSVRPFSRPYLERYQCRIGDPPGQRPPLLLDNSLNLEAPLTLGATFHPDVVEPVAMPCTI
jgi:hypothetical protein